MEQDSLRYCGVFDLVWNESSEFATLLVKNCLSGVTNRKSIIIPPAKVIRKIAKLSSDEQKPILMNYILSRTKSIDELKKESKVLTIGGKEYNVREESDKIYLNDVAIELLKVHKERSIFKAENELLPNSSGGSCGAAKFDEDLGSDVEEELIGIEEDDESTTEDDEEDYEVQSQQSIISSSEDSEDSSSSEEEVKLKKKKKKTKKVGGVKPKRKKSSTTKKKKKSTTTKKKTTTTKKKKKSIKGGQSSKTKKKAVKYIPF